MKWIPPKKLKVLMFLFFGTGAWGIIAGTFFLNYTSQHMFVTFFGVINICIGGFIGYRYFTQGPKPEKLSEKRKKQRRDD